MSKNSTGAVGLISIMSIAFVSMAFTSTTPAMAAIAAQFPEAGQNISLLSNGYIITLVPMTILSGWLTNSGKLKFKTATMLGSFFMLLGGAGPAVIHGSFEIILVWKFIFGIGLGLLTPLANALILNLYEGNKQARYLGWVTLLMNFGGILFQMFGGILVDSFGAGAGGDGWYMHFWAYALCVVPLIFSFFIPEPEIQPNPVAADGSAGKKQPIGIFVVIAGVFLFLINLFNYPTMMYLASLFIERGIGGETAATAAATALSLFTVAGVVAGATYGTLFKILKRFILPAGYILMAFGAALIYFASDAIMATCGTIFLGFGFSLIMPSFMSLLGMKTHPTRTTIATSITMAIMNLGAIVVTPYLGVLVGITGDGLPLYNMILMIEMIGLALVGVIFIFWNLYPKTQAPIPENA